MSENPKNLRVLYFGSYDPEYSRNAVLIKGLKENNIKVLECRDNSPGLRKYSQLFKKHWKLRNDYDFMVVGFLGQAIVPFAKMITRKPIVFDAFLSLYDLNVFDRKIVKKGTPKSLYYWFLDWLSMNLADLVLFDTNENINYTSSRNQLYH